MRQRLEWIAKRLEKVSNALDEDLTSERAEIEKHEIELKEERERQARLLALEQDRISRVNDFVLQKATVEEYLESDQPFLHLGPILFSGSDSAYMIMVSSTSWAQAYTVKALEQYSELLRYLRESQLDIIELREVYPDSHGTPHLFSGRHRFMGWDYSESELEFKGLPAQTLEDPNDLRKRYQIWKQSLEAT